MAEALKLARAAELAGEVPVLRPSLVVMESITT